MDNVLTLIAPPGANSLGRAALEASREAVLAIAGRLDIDPKTLTLDLGPLGRLV